jgi:GntR family transcriptional regulator/MocR family aminotransferase
MLALYAERHEILVQASQRELGGLLDVAPTESGMHIIGWLPESMDDLVASRKAAKYGIDASPLSNYCFDEKLRGALVLGFAGVNEDDIKAGVHGLCQALS